MCECAAVGERDQLGEGVGALGTTEEGCVAALRADVGGGCGGCSWDGGHGGGRAAAEGGGERHFPLSFVCLPC